MHKAVMDEMIRNIDAIDKANRDVARYAVWLAASCFVLAAVAVAVLAFAL